LVKNNIFNNINFNYLDVNPYIPDILKEYELKKGLDEFIIRDDIDDVIFLV
jgi:hypothetical protein